MRYSNFAIAAICAVSLTALAETTAADTKSMSEDSKTEFNKPNTKIAALAAGGNPSNRRKSNASPRKTSSPAAVQTSDNVQGLAPTDRRYRYHD